MNRDTDGVSHDEELGTYTTTYDLPERPPSSAVVEAILEIEGLDPDRLAPLYTAVDPDALDSIFDDTRRENPGTSHLSFRYEGYLVRIHGDGTIQLTPEDDSSARQDESA